MQPSIFWWYRLNSERKARKKRLFSFFKLWVQVRKKLSEKGLDRNIPPFIILSLAKGCVVTLLPYPIPWARRAVGPVRTQSCTSEELPSAALTRTDIWASGPPGVKAHWGQTNFYKHWCQPYLWSKKLSRYSSHWCPTHDCAAFEGVKNFQTFYLKLLDSKKQKVCISIWTLITCNYFTTLLNIELRLNR